MTPIFKLSVHDQILAVITSCTEGGDLPKAIGVPKQYLRHGHGSIVIPLPPVRRGLTSKFMTHTIQLVESFDGEVRLASLMPRQSDRIAALVQDTAKSGRELEAIELTDYEASVLSMEQRTRLTYVNALYTPEDTEWGGVFMGVPLRLEKAEDPEF